MATLHELSTVYSLEEARQMYEVLLVENFNEWLSYKQSEMEAGRHR
jgi:hypothetical protein